MHTLSSVKLSCADDALSHTTQGGDFASLPRSALSLCNTSALSDSLLRPLLARFDAAFACRAHVAAFVAEGLDAAELAAARYDVAALAEEYDAAAADTLPGGEEARPGRAGAPAEA